MDVQKAKFYRDQHVLDQAPKVDDKATAVTLLNVSPENYDAIRGKKVPEKMKGAIRKITDKVGQAESFYDIQPIYYDESGLWWLWYDGICCWQRVDEITICNALYDSGNVDTIDSTERNEIFQALKQVGRKYRPLPLPPTWIQFKDILVDIQTGEERKATSEYFTVNPIPYRLHPERYIETPHLDKIFIEWVGEDKKRLLYEIIAYCLLADYPIHRLFCFIGGGLNGKSCYLRLISKFVGNENICSTELDTLIGSRFEVARLHKKLVCQMGETNFSELTKTSILKKLTGQDMIGYEYKNKTPFEDKNYAKILIATNNLPETTDKTDGFYRRWCIVDFPNRFSEGRDILADIPEEEFEALAVKCVSLLHDLLKERKFHKEGTLEERQKIYEDKSNPFDKFMKENVIEDNNEDIPKWEFEKRFNTWCQANRFRTMSEITINAKMKEKGVFEIRPMKEWYENNFKVQRQVRCWGGISWKG